MNLERDMECVGNEILNLFNTTKFTTCLASITAEKGNDFILGNFACVKYGWADMEAELPALYVMGLREELIRDDGKDRWMTFRFAIEVYDTGDDPQNLEKKLNRYARAVSEALLAEYKDDGTIQAVEYSPVLKNADNLYKVCSVQFSLKIFQDLT
jgi:hypothetical protein